ncbi:hypothetical protein [Bradyrhizobium sp. 5.13L]
MIFMIGEWMTDSCSRRERFAKRAAMPPPTQDRTGFRIEVTMACDGTPDQSGAVIARMRAE